MDKLIGVTQTMAQLDEMGAKSIASLMQELDENTISSLTELAVNMYKNWGPEIKEDPNNFGLCLVDIILTGFVIGKECGQEVTNEEEK